MTNPLVVLYDGECGFCQQAMRWLQTIDKTHRLRLLPLQSQEVSQRFPNLPIEALRRDIHVVAPDGSVYLGATAYREIGRVISGQTFSGVILKLYSAGVKLPGMLPLAETLYRQIASNRYRLPWGRHRCETDHCSVDEPS